MFEFLGLGKKKKPIVEKKPVDNGPLTVHLSANQLETVRMTLHGVLKVNGIPGSWISGEVIPVHIPGQGEALLIQLEIMYWHDTLVLHAPAFQQAVLEGMQRFDPNSRRSRFLFAWKYSPHSGCPHKHLPEPDYWQTSERVVLPPFPAPTAAEPEAPEPVAAPHPAPAAFPPAAMPRPHTPMPVPADSHDDDDDHGFAATQIPHNR